MPVKSGKDTRRWADVLLYLYDVVPCTPSFTEIAEEPTHDHEEHRSG